MPITAPNEYPQRDRPLSFEDAIAAELERLRNKDGWVDQDRRKSSHVAYLARGLYAEQLHRWLTLFPREQLLILKSVDFFQRPAEGIHLSKTRALRVNVPVSTVTFIGMGEAIDEICRYVTTRNWPASCH